LKYDGGKIHRAQIDLGKDDADHFISPEERLCIAIARQYGRKEKATSGEGGDKSGTGIRFQFRTRR
jgi:hypothetical protein